MPSSRVVATPSDRANTDEMTNAITEGSISPATLVRKLEAGVLHPVDPLTRPESACKSKLSSFMRSTQVECVSMALTMYALFARDAMLATDGAYANGVDDKLGFVTFFVALLFTVECMCNSWVWKGYFPGLFFVLDVIATISLYSEVPFIEKSIFGSGGTVARAGRAARVGTRVGRILRLVRLIRVIRMLRAVNTVKEKQLQRQQTLRKEAQIKRIRDNMEARKQELVEDAILSAAESPMKLDTHTGTHSKRTSRVKAAARQTVSRKLVEIDELQHAFEKETAANASHMEDDAGSLANRMSNVMTIKVVAGVLFMMLILPLLQVDIDPLEAEVNRVGDGLRTLNLTIGSAVEQEQLEGFKELHPKVYYITAGTRVLVGSVTANAKAEMELRSNERVGVCAYDPRPNVVVVPCEPNSAFTVYALVSTRHFASDMARSNVYVTVFVLVMLVAGALSITRDSNKLAGLITGPLIQLSRDMESIALLDLRQEFLEERPPKFKNSIAEMEIVLSSFFRMKTGIGSFSKYAPLPVVKGMMRAGEIAKLGVVRKPVSILFSDIAGFTTICESMQPNQLLELLSDYFQQMSEIIDRTDGILAEFIGDAILALWNCPGDVERHGQLAVEAAIRMQESVSACRRRWLEKDYPPIAIRVGVHTAEVFVGNIGSAERMKYGVLGDGVNLASRLEELNKRYSTKILCSDQTYAQKTVSSSYLTRPVDTVVVKGKKLPTKVHEVMGRLCVSDAHKCTDAIKSVAAPDGKSDPLLFNSDMGLSGYAIGYDQVKDASEQAKLGFDAYLTKDFPKARKFLAEAKRLLGGTDAASDLLDQRCAALEQCGVPDDWDGAEVLKEKTFDDNRDHGKGIGETKDKKMKRKISLAVGTDTNE